jgi:hypothetical protein
MAWTAPSRGPGAAAAGASAGCGLGAGLGGLFCVFLPGRHGVPDRDHQQVGLAADADPADDELAGDQAVRGEQAAPDQALPAGPADRGELGVNRGARRQVDEGRERPAGGVPGLGPDQVARRLVDPLDRAVAGEQEQRNGRVAERRPQQTALGAVAARRLTAVGLAATRPGLHRPEQVDRAFKLGKRGVEHIAWLGALRPGRLAERGIAGRQAGDLDACLVTR